MSTRWVVWCNISGGVTGNRTGMLKNTNGEIVYFTTLTEAETKAHDLTVAMATSSGRTFRYWVEEA